MSNSSPQSNNVKLTFRRKAERERAMPAVSKAQNAAMQAAAEGKSKIGIPQKVGEEFADAQAPRSVRDLPVRKTSRVAKLRARGLISDKQAEKLERE